MGHFRNVWQENKDEELAYFLFLSMCNCVGIRTYTKMQSYFSSPKSFYKSDELKWEKTGIFTKKQLERFSAAKKTLDPVYCIDAMRDAKIQMLIYECDDYPRRLKEIKDPPPILFLKGKLPEGGRPVVSVIGARECSEYGARVAALLGAELAKRKISVVSGMARGIDAISQEAALEASGYSLAVLGGGVDVIYPKESKTLYRHLCETGGILSEFAPGTELQKPYFALRNRLVSGLSDVVCVVEAKEKSGTLITVDHALEQGREVFAVPGRLSDITSFGTNELIREGAGIISNVSLFADEVVENYAKETARAVKPCDGAVSFAVPVLNEIETRVMKNIDENSFTVDQMSAKTGAQAYELIGVCMSLTGRDYMESMGAGRFRATKRGIDAKNALFSAL